MSAIRFTAAVIAIAGLAALAQPAMADSVEARCEVSKDGNKWKGASGPCEFSQRQGYVSLDLANGDKYSLTPTGKADHFKDQRGNKVERTKAGDNSHTYKWEGDKPAADTPQARPIRPARRHRTSPIWWAPRPARPRANCSGAATSTRRAPPPATRSTARISMHRRVAA